MGLSSMLVGFLSRMSVCLGWMYVGLSRVYACLGWMSVGLSPTYLSLGRMCVGPSRKSVGCLSHVSGSESYVCGLPESYVWVVCMCVWAGCLWV